MRLLAMDARLGTLAIVYIKTIFGCHRNRAITKTVGALRAQWCSHEEKRLFWGVSLSRGKCATAKSFRHMFLAAPACLLYRDGPSYGGSVMWYALMHRLSYSAHAPAVLLHFFTSNGFAVLRFPALIASILILSLHYSCNDRAVYFQVAGTVILMVPCSN